MPIGISNGVLNQKNAPAIYEDIFANRPSAGFSGRIFISTDTSQIFVDNGTSWVLIANTGIGSTGNLQVVTTNGNTTNTGISITAGGLATNAVQITSLTGAGGVLFTDGSGNINQDVTNLVWDDINYRLGIGGTGSPSAPLDIHDSSTNVQIQLNATSTNNSTLAFQNASVGKWRVGNLYSAGANLFHIYNTSNASIAMQITSTNATTFNGSVTGTSLIKSGGTSNQFLKADGSVDSSSYITLTSLSGSSPLQYNNSTGAFSILQAGASQSGYLSSTDWTTFNSKASLTTFSATTPLSYNSGTGAFSIQVANTGQSGYLSNTDWNTFNNKQTALSFGNLTETSSSILTIAGGTGAVIGSGTTIAVKQSSSTQSGYLSSTDWTTFNSKQAQINGTGFVKATGTTISYDNSTYYLASNPSSYITLASLSGTTPISYNSGTGAISIALANTSTSGYLSSTDWNTFNSKASLTAFSASPPLSYNSGTGAFSITQSSGSTNGYLSSTDWTTFNSKQSALTNPVTGTGTSGYVVKFNGSTTVTNSIIQDSGTALTINGLVGIGLTPSITLDINANSGIGGWTGFRLKYGTSSVQSLSMGQVTGGNGAWIGMSQYNSGGYWQTEGTAASVLAFNSDGSFNISTDTGLTPNTNYNKTIRLTLSNNGNLGLGTSSPNLSGSGTALTVNAASSANAAIEISDGGTLAGLIFGKSGTSVNLWSIPAIPLIFGTNNAERMRITSGGIINTTSRLNVNGAVDNSLFSLNSGGTLYTGGFSPNATANSTNTLTLTNAQTTWIYNGTGIATWTLFNPSGTNQMIWIKNAGTGIITLNAYSGTNIINNAGSSVSSITIAIGATVLIQQDGNVKSYQLQ